MVTCRYCGRELTARASVAAGYGPECAARLNLPDPERLAYLFTLSEPQRLRAVFERPLRRR